MKERILAVIIVIIFCACNNAGDNKMLPVKTANKHWVDSIIAISDSSYSKPYKRTDFVTAYYYVNKKDSSICQVMKDSAGVIRQIILSKQNARKYFASFYSNGQIEADLPLDEYGQFNGTAVYYFFNGKIQSTGKYVHGFKNGKWDNFNETGEKLPTEEYDENGRLIKTNTDK